MSSEQQQFSSQPSGTLLFIGNLSWGTSNDDLKQAFSEYNITDARVLTDRETGRSRGFGFLTFPTEEEATKAIEAKNNTEIAGRQIRLDRATERQRN